MKITAFSDTHGHHRDLQLPKSDMLIFAGDAMTCGYKERELVDFLIWYSEQKAKHKIMIAGNHDRYIENYPSRFKELLAYYPDITYLENSGVKIEGINIWGTPDSKMFYRWAFNQPEEKLAKIFKEIPDDTNILISHAPAYGVLDWLDNGDCVGERTLLNNLSRLTYLRHHISGHIHCAYGCSGVSANVSVVDEMYKLCNPPLTFVFGKKH